MKEIKNLIRYVPISNQIAHLFSYKKRDLFPLTFKIFRLFPNQVKFVIETCIFIKRPRLMYVVSKCYLTDNSKSLSVVVTDSRCRVFFSTSLEFHMLRYVHTSLVHCSQFCYAAKLYKMIVYLITFSVSIFSLLIIIIS